MRISLASMTGSTRSGPELLWRLGCWKAPTCTYIIYIFGPSWSIISLCVVTRGEQRLKSELLSCGCWEAPKCTFHAPDPDSCYMYGSNEIIIIIIIALYMYLYFRLNGCDLEKKRTICGTHGLWPHRKPQDNTPTEAHEASFRTGRRSRWSYDDRYTSTRSN